MCNINLETCPAGCGFVPKIVSCVTPVYECKNVIASADPNIYIDGADHENLTKEISQIIVAYIKVFGMGAISHNRCLGWKREALRGQCTGRNNDATDRREGSQ